jgi:hypothetical protein
VNGQQRRLGSLSATKLPEPAVRTSQPSATSHAQRLVDRHPAHGKLLAQGGLGRDPVA